MKYITRISAVLLFMLVLISNIVRAEEVRIVIDEAVDGAQPIAVVPFKWNGPGTAPADLAEIISSDLRNSGKFNPIPVSRMPQTPSSVAEVNPEAWAALGLTEIVVGQITPTGSGYNIAYQLVDTIGGAGTAGSVLLQNSYNIPNNQQLRYGAHTVSDEVFEKLTTIRGAFRTRIAYVVQRNGGANPYELRVADYDGHNQFVVNRSSQPIMSPSWSADGKQLAYVSFENRKSQLVVQDLGSGSRKVVASAPRHNGAPSFSPDGSRLAYASSRDGQLNIYVLNLASGQTTQLTSGAGNNTEPSWSPDGQSIVFTSDRGGSPQVYMMSAYGGGASYIGAGGRSYSGEITSDGKSLIMISADHIVKKDLASANEEVKGSTY